MPKTLRLVDSTSTSTSGSKVTVVAGNFVMRRASYTKNFASTRVCSLNSNSNGKIENVQMVGLESSQTVNFNDVTVKKFIADASLYASLDIPKLTGVVCSTAFFNILRVEMQDISFNYNYCIPSSFNYIVSADTLIMRRVEVAYFTSSGMPLSITALNGEIEDLSIHDISSSNVGGVIRIVAKALNKSKVTVRNANIFNVNLSVAGVMRIESADVSIQSSTFSQNTAGLYGSAILVDTSEVMHRLEIMSSKFINNSCPLLGTITVFRRPNATSYVSIDSCEFVGNSAQYGSAIYIERGLAQDSSIRNSSFKDNVASESGTVYIGASAPSFEISKCSFSSNKALKVAALDLTITLGSVAIKECTFDKNSGKILISMPYSSARMQLQIYQSKLIGNAAVALNLNNCDLTDSESLYQGNSQTVAVLASSSSASFSKSKFLDNFGAEIGGVAYVTDSSAITLRNCDVSGNKASVKAGALYIQMDSKLEAYDTSFTQNQSPNTSVLALSFTLETKSVLENCSITSNSSGSNGSISLSESSIEIRRSSFQANSEEMGASPGINLFKSDAVISDSAFRSQVGYRGTFINSLFNSNLTVVGSSFYEGSAEAQGGAIYAELTTLKIEGSSFTNMKAAKGGALFLDKSTSAISGSSFQSNSARFSGADVYAHLESIQVTNSSFTDSFLESISAEAVSFVKVSGSTFKSGKGSSRVYAEASSLVEIESSTFQENSGVEGSAVLVESVTNLTVNSSSFFNNSGCDGGSVFVRASNATITSNNFTSNSASCGEGGAVFVHCEADCSTSLSLNSFVNNSARASGGAVKWSAIKPTFDNNSFIDNTALYGGDFASFPKTVQFSRLSSSQRNQKDGNLSEVIVSGQAVESPLLFELTDSEVQPVANDNSTLCELSTGTSAELAGPIKAVASKGQLQFVGFTLTGSPGSQVNLTVSCSKEEILPFSLELFLRNCERGESKQGNQCKKCSPGFYSFDPAEPCKECDRGAECFGNFTVIPKGGFWRKDEDSENFYECPKKSACLGYDDSEMSLTGKCSEGYKGVKCSGCERGYARTGRFECSKCSQTSLALFVRSVFFIAAACFIIVTVVLSLKAVEGSRSLVSIFFKILMNFFQLAVIISNFKLKWPSLILQLLEAQFRVAESAGFYLSSNCFFKDNDSKETFYLNLIIATFLPCLLVSLALVAWSLIKLWRNVANFKYKVLCSMTVLIFIVHPQVTKTMFSVYSCEEVDGEYWISTDQSIRCWDSQHTLYATSLALPSIVIWVVSLPLLSTYYLFKKRACLDELSTKYTIGFLYNGFKQQVFYWELCIFYRKLSIIIIAVFMNHYEKGQAFVASCVLLACYIVQYKVQPFVTRKLNVFEELSIFTSAITVVFGHFIVTKELGFVTEMVLFTILVIVYSSYFAVWLKETIGFPLEKSLLRIKALRKSCIFKCIAALCFRSSVYSEVSVVPEADSQKQSYDLSSANLKPFFDNSVFSDRILVNSAECFYTSDMKL
mmetsp:Transcript_16966/g.30530  ORF Transcript_16966/g.30530 Transcript_16966/m.30530 type:complete len:1496 (+) Transcript_16966:1585-6072(+)